MLGSVPTMVFFILLVIAYRFLVGRPLARTLGERAARTSGAIQQARAAISTAESETAAYEERLHAARNEIRSARERRLQQWQAQSERALAEARGASQERVKAARLDIERAAAAARKQIEDVTSELGEQILRAVLPPSTQPSEARPS